MALRRLGSEETQAFIKRVAEECIQQIARCTVPIFVYLRDQLTRNGSGTLLQIADRHFIVSAAHVLDIGAIHKIPCYLPSDSDHRFIQLTGVRSYFTPAPTGRDEKAHDLRQGDHEDVAVCELTPEMVQRILPTRRFARLNEVSKRKGFFEGVYMVIGYPNEYTRPMDEAQTKISAEPFRCVTGLYRGELPEHDPDAHIFLAYPREGLDQYDRAFVPPHARGISGGGIWRLAEATTPLDRWRPEDARFVAVEHEWHAGKRYIRGTNVAMALALIYRYNPDLRSSLDLECC